MALKPEVIGDVEEGAPAPGVRDEMGLLPDERAAWDEMEAAAKDNSPAADEPEPAPEPEAATKPEGAPPPVETASDGEDDDVEPAEGQPAVDPKTGRAPQKQVNWNKHQRELKKREEKASAAEQRAAAFETELRVERENRVKLAERLAILNEALTAPPPADPVVERQKAVAANPMLEPDIDVSVDALGAIEQGQRRIAYLQKEGAQKYEVTQATLEDRQIRDEFQRDADTFARTEEGQHFPAAYQFLKDSRLTELAISKFDKDPNDPAQVFTPAEIAELVNDFNTEEKWVVGNARKAGKSPALAIMKLARGRGFKPQAAAAAPPAPVPAAPAKNGNGAAPGSAVAKIKAEAEGAAASRSLSDGGGAPPIEALTAERLLKMPDAEFKQYVDNLPKEHLDAIMGRPAA